MFKLSSSSSPTLYNSYKNTYSQKDIIDKNKYKSRIEVNPIKLIFNKSNKSNKSKTTLSTLSNVVCILGLIKTISDQTLNELFIQNKRYKIHYIFRETEYSAYISFFNRLDADYFISMHDQTTLKCKISNYQNYDIKIQVFFVDPCISNYFNLCMFRTLYKYKHPPIFSTVLQVFATTKLHLNDWISLFEQAFDIIETKDRFISYICFNTIEHAINAYNYISQYPCIEINSSTNQYKPYPNFKNETQLLVNDQTSFFNIFISAKFSLLQNSHDYYYDPLVQHVFNYLNL